MNITKNIIIGKVREEFYDLPIRMFRMAVRLSKQDDFVVNTNNPQFIEALEVLCGEENINVYFKSSSSKQNLQRISFQNAYDYLGEVYDIINILRSDSFFNRVNDEKIIKLIKEYDDKWKKLEEG